MRQTVFLFGEAEKGDFCTPLLCKSLPQLAETFGNPPKESQGLLLAVQTLLFEKDLIYFRVKEEGYSIADYRRGIGLLTNKVIVPHLAAIAMPGVGDAELIEATSAICHSRRSLLLFSEKDLYDYLTNL